MVAGVRLSQQDFISKSNQVHNFKYDYSLVQYKNYKSKVNIICPIHGTFSQIAGDHLYKCGCPNCGKDKVMKVATQYRKSTDEFIKESNLIHNNKYDYSKTKYIDWKTKITIICPEHGEFQQTPNSHTSGKNGCSSCAAKSISIQLLHNTEIFIQKSKIIHGDIYDYSCTNYSGDRHTVSIICKIHGVFQQVAGYHLSGCGCQKCKSSKGEIEIRKVLERLSVKYNEQYKFKDCKNKMSLPFDFYLPEKNMCIEYDGEHHYKEISRGKNPSSQLKRIKNNDGIKTNYCKKNGIHLLRIPFWDFAHIEEILKNQLNIS